MRLILWLTCFAGFWWPQTSQGNPKLLQSEAARIDAVYAGSPAEVDHGIRRGQKIQRFGDLINPSYPQLAMYPYQDNKWHEKTALVNGQELNATTLWFSCHFEPDWTESGKAWLQDQLTQLKAGEVFDFQAIARRLEGQDQLSEAIFAKLSVALYDAEYIQEALPIAISLEQSRHPIWQFVGLLDHIDVLNQLTQTDKSLAKFDAVKAHTLLKSSSWAKLHAHLAMARSALSHDRFEDAETYIKIVQTLIKDTKLDFYETQVQNTHGLIAKQREEGESALAAFQASIQALKKYRPKSIGLAQKYNNLAIAYSINGDFDQAKHYYAEALAITTKVNPDSMFLGQLHMNLGVNAAYEGLLKTAADHLETAYILIRKHGKGELGEGQLALNLGAVCLGLGDSSRALQYFLRGLEILEVKNPESSHIHRIYNNLSGLYASIGDYAAAQTYLDQAIKRLRAANSSVSEIGMSMIQAANLARYQGFYQQSERYLLEVLEQAEGEDLDILYLPRAHHALGKLYTDMNRLEEAEHQLSLAHDLYFEINPEYPALQTNYMLQGEIARKRGQYDHALQWLDRAQSLYKEDQMGELYYASVHSYRGDIYSEMGNIEDAIEQHRIALKAAETNILNQIGIAAETSSAKEIVLYDQRLVHALLKAEDQQAAWMALEYSRARKLREWLREKPESWFDQTDPDWLRDFEKLSHQQKAVLRQSESQDEAERQAAIADWRTLLQRQELLMTRLSTSQPRLSQLINLEQTPFESLEKHIPERGVVMGFMVGDRETAVMCMWRNATGGITFKHHFVAIERATLADKVWLLHGMVSDITLAQAGDVNFQPLAENLRQMLLAPFAEAIESAEKVWLIPDDSLNFLPTGILFQPYQKVPTLVPSIQVMTLIQQSRQTKATQANLWVGIGAPNSSALRPDAPTLTGGREELQQIADRLGKVAQVYIGEQATVAQLKAKAKQAQVMHIASHAFSDAYMPMLSGIEMQASANQEDGVLRAWEIFRDLRTNAELVVLSGCETGGGQVRGGEGVMGLSQAFLYAGAQNLMVSQWAVEDHFTALFMARFYDMLLTGMSQREALFATQEYFRSQSIYQHPYFWSAFQIIGEGAPLSSFEGIEKRISNAVWLALAASLMALLTVFYSLYLRNQRT